MDVTTFFTRLLQAPKETERIKLPDDIASFDAAWRGIKASTCSIWLVCIPQVLTLV